MNQEYWTPLNTMSASACALLSAKKELNVMASVPLILSLPPLTKVLVFAQKTTFVLSLVLTSTPGATSPASSNLKTVPGIDCHWAKAARTAFNSAAVFDAEKASEARKKRTARVAGLTTLV